jgi:protein-L-isoaspartate(D-aspartate) O-methyltransferase
MNEMLDTLRNGYHLHDETVLSAMAAVPRHLFVPKRLQAEAYADSALPIGHGQTISQPYIVAEMTRQLQLNSQSRVLEIGTGSGYQTAVLSRIAGRVYSIEIVPQLAELAMARFQALGFDNIQLLVADGFDGWPEEAPFEAIIVTCAPPEIPPPLLEQLAPGGRLILPVGRQHTSQSLTLVEKDQEGRLHRRNLLAVSFVPLVRAGHSRRSHS